MMLRTISSELIHCGRRSRGLVFTTHNVVEVDVQTRTFPRGADLHLGLVGSVAVIYLRLCGYRRQQARWCYLCSNKIVSYSSFIY